MGDLRFAGGLAQGIAQGYQQGQQMDLLHEKQKLEKQHFDLQQQMDKWKLKTYGTLTPEESKAAIGATPKDPLKQMQVNLLTKVLSAYGMDLPGTSGDAGAISLPQVIAQQNFGVGEGAKTTGQPTNAPQRFDWQAPGAEEIMNFALTGDSKDLVPPTRTADLGDRIAILRGPKMVGTIPKTVKKDLTTYVDSDGNTRNMVWNPYAGQYVIPPEQVTPQQGGPSSGQPFGSAPPPLSGGVKEPSKTELPQPLGETAQKELKDLNTTQSNLNWLIQNVKGEYLGAKGWIGGTLDTYSGTLSDLGPLGTFVTGVAKNVLGVDVDPKRATWQTLYNEMKGQKIKARGGSAVTETELRFIMQSLPLITQSKEVFEAVSSGVNDLLEIDKNELLSSYLTPQREQYRRNAKILMDKYQNEVKPILENAMGKKSSVEEEAMALKKKLGIQ